MAEVGRIMKCAEKKKAWRDRALVALGVRTGFRISELLSLNIGQVAERAGHVWRPRDFITIKSESMKGAQAARTAAVPVDAQAALSDWLYELQPTKTKAPLFASRSGRKAITRMQAHRIIQTLCRQARVPVDLVATHTMRKTFAAVAFRKCGKRLKEVQKLMDHKKARTTESYLSFQQLAAWEKLYGKKTRAKRSGQ